MFLRKAKIDFTKSDLRQEYRQRRSSFLEKRLGEESVSFAEELSLQMQFNDHLEKVLSRVSSSGEIWATYAALENLHSERYSSEVNLKYFNHLYSQLSWVYPVVDGDDLRFFKPSVSLFEFLQVEDEANVKDWVKGPFGIWQPDVQTAQEVSLSQIKGFLIPGVAFDVFGGRLGQGRGFYDRVLQGSQGLKVGVAYSCQVSEQALPVESNDVFMDLVVTEEGTAFSVSEQ